ncbi:MAG: glycosyltransferase, partial [Candidatus Micrarchaeota archaeon]|nr:glycosyltransferase [Candidatus Micrarchaeota archaeon]
MADAPVPSPGSGLLRPQASVIVLSYNSKADLASSLPAVLAQAGATFELVVVDNASSDGSADWVAQAYPQGAGSPQSAASGASGSPGAARTVPVKLVRSPENGGYAASNNLG